MSTKLNSIKYLAIIVLALLVSCGKLKGEFAIKNAMDDNYRRITRSLEFAREDEIQWAYIFQNNKIRHKIGVIILKKELVWVEVTSYTSIIDINNNIVHGTIKDYPPGDYQIVLTDVENNNFIEKKDFLIYSRAEDRAGMENYR